MPIPNQITFRNMRSSPAVRERIRALLARLDRFDARIESCRVVVRAAHRRQRQGKLYQVSIDLKVPGHEIAVTRDPAEHHAHEDINVAVRDAFDALTRRLEDVVRRRRGDVKRLRPETRGRPANSPPRRPAAGARTRGSAE